MSLDDCWRQRLLYLHLTVLWAERCSGQIKPFACRVNGVAAIATRALDPAGVWPFASAGVAASSHI